MTTFSELDLIESLQRALAEEGYTTPTPIQSQAIPPLLQGRDLLGVAQTGTGKTAAFALPILQRLAQGQPRGRRSVRALILTPTRELAAQIADSFARYGRHLKLSHAVVYGGVGKVPQIRALRAGVDILIATPGRLLDLMGDNCVRTEGLEVLVLDEADRMLDMGFAPDVKRIIATLPKLRQTLLFSATMPQDIAVLADRILANPVKVAVTPVATTAERVKQHVLFVDTANKRALLADLIKGTGISRAIVFTRTKHGASRLADQLGRGGISADAIHGNKSQAQRERALDNFRRGRCRVLVATDIAARGIDVDGISHVINFDLPNEPESYVHRIGRTARAGASGSAISFCSADERDYLRAIERLIRQPIEVVDDHPYHCATAQAANGNARPSGQQRGRPPRGRRPERRYGRRAA
ncbi:MAG TPA: DEAD/DEAH box helicase [Alphaproteobacteria bacterium]|nr:DEAD/DEAH box helicase [Alphaproteobacteria bacterium]